MSRRAGELIGVMCALGVAACGAETDGSPATTAPSAATCMSENPASEPFDVGDVVPIGLSPDSPGVPATLGDVLGYCRSARARDCDASRLISRAAAACIATLEGFDEGREPSSVGLHFYGNFERLAWSLEGQFVERRPDAWTQSHMVIDAITGDVLANGNVSVQF
jgi:hypothetical protein